MKLMALIFLTLIYSSILFGKSAVINKIYVDRNEAQAEFLADYLAFPKQHLIARFANGENCYLEIKRVYKRHALLDLRYCNYRFFIKTGQTLSRWEEIEEDVDLVSISKAPDDKLFIKEDYWFDAVEDIEKREREEKLKVSQGIALSVLWSFANEITTSGTLAGGNTFDTTENTTGAFGLGVEYFYSKQGAVGWNAGWIWEMKRTFTDTTVNFNGSISTLPLDDETLWLNVLFANINFTIPWKVYLYGGINLSIPIENGNGIKTNPFLGGQIGFGKIITDIVIIDLNYRFINFKGAGEYSSIISEWESAAFDGVVFSVKYLFD